MNRSFDFVKSLGSTLLDLVLPPSCVGCGTLLATGELCDFCSELCELVTSPKCRVCDLPFRGAGEDHLCGRCIESLPRFRSTSATFRYAGAIADGVTAVKYGGRFDRLGPLSRLWRDHCTSLPEVELVIPVPLHPSKLRQRGFNQTVLLAKPLLESRGLRLTHGALRRARAGRSQAGLPRSERLAEPKGAYVVTPRGREIVKGRRALLVDDIMTTGATLNECAKVLMNAGAEEVHVAVLARAS